MSTVGTFVRDYVHHSNEKLQSLLDAEGGCEPMSQTLRDQIISDLKSVLHARKVGRAWAWNGAAYLSAGPNFDAQFDQFAQLLNEQGIRILAEPGTASHLGTLKIPALLIVNVQEILPSLFQPRSGVVDYNAFIPSYIDVVYVQPSQKITAQQCVVLDAAMRGKRFVFCHHNQLVEAAELIHGRIQDKTPLLIKLSAIAKSEIAKYRM